MYSSRNGTKLANMVMGPKSNVFVYTIGGWEWDYVELVPLFFCSF
jgi:hypothetical protein